MDISKFKEQTTVYCIKDVKHELKEINLDYSFIKNIKYHCSYMFIDDFYFLLIWDENGKSLAFFNAHKYMEHILDCFITLTDYRNMKINNILNNDTFR